MRWVEFGSINQYRVSSCGKIQTRSRVGRCGGIESEWREKSSYLGVCDKHGGAYLKIGLHDKGKSKTEYVHRVVAAYHIGEIPDGMQVNHIDGNRLNNDVSNLEIVTPRENIKNAVGRGVFNGRNSFSGKIDEFSILAIITLINSGWKNPEISNFYNIDKSNISKIRNKKRLFKTFLFLVEDNIKSHGTKKTSWI